MKRRPLTLTLGLTLALALAGCGAEGRVTRVYDGRIVEGRFIPPDAYASFLRGALAEDAGDLKGALGAYVTAADMDEEDVEIHTRIAEIRCKLDPADAEADRAFAHALKLDPSYAGALAGKARCLMARGRTDEAAELARRATAQDPPNVGLQALLSRAEAPRGDPTTRERVIALTLAHGDHAAAWDALIAWGNARHDAELVARGLEGLVRATPTRSPEAERGAVALLDGGQLALARRVATAVADAPRELGVIGPRDATVARLAVDDALAKGDRNLAQARATRGHVPLDEVAARALVLGQKEMAAAIATTVTEGDPNSSGAQMVRAALAGTPASAGGSAAAAAATKKRELPRASDQPPEICALVFADRLATAAGAEVAKAWLAKITRTPMASRDPLAGPLAVDLAARGVLPVGDLPAELRASVPRAHAME